jgi:hypothetical protein
MEPELSGCEFEWRWVGDILDIANGAGGLQIEKDVIGELVFSCFCPIDE